MARERVPAAGGGKGSRRAATAAATTPQALTSPWKRPRPPRPRSVRRGRRRELQGFYGVPILVDAHSSAQLIFSGHINRSAHELTVFTREPQQAVEHLAHQRQARRALRCERSRAAEGRLGEVAEVAQAATAQRIVGRQPRHQREAAAAQRRRRAAGAGRRRSRPCAARPKCSRMKADAVAREVGPRGTAGRARPPCRRRAGRPPPARVAQQRHLEHRPAAQRFARDRDVHVELVDGGRSRRPDDRAQVGMHLQQPVDARLQAAVRDGRGQTSVTRRSSM